MLLDAVDDGHLGEELGRAETNDVVRGGQRLVPPGVAAERAVADALHLGQQQRAALRCSGRSAVTSRKWNEDLGSGQLSLEHLERLYVEVVVGGPCLDLRAARRPRIGDMPMRRRPNKHAGFGKELVHMEGVDAIQDGSPALSEDGHVPFDRRPDAAVFGDDAVVACH